MTSRRGRGRSPKSPTFWDRFSFSANTPVGSIAPTTVNIVDPTFYNASTLDEDWTVRGIRLSLAYRYFAPIGVVGAMPVLRCGVLKESAIIGGRDPAILSAEDGETDWLDLWVVQFPPGPVVAISTFGFPLNREGSMTRNIKSQRRLSTNMGINFAMSCFFLPGPQDVNFICSVNVVVSTLVSRTVKRS